MLINAILATTFLGSASITTVAAPASPIVRDHRTEARFPRPMPVTYAPVTLANDLSLHNRSVIKVDASRRFSTLELRAEGRGKVAIDKVQVVFANGRSQTIKLDKKLSPQEPTLTVDLAGNEREITRIVIDGRAKNPHAVLDVIGR
jgi:hypothetical protein